MMFEASIVPSARAGADDVCNSSMKRIMFLERRISRPSPAFDALFELAAEFCAGNHQTRVQGDDALSRTVSGTLPPRFLADLQRWRSADTRFA